jgi:hypothetical protein
MKLKFLSISLFSLGIISPFFIPSLTPAAKAVGCVAIAVTPQISVRGSKQPATQTNTVNQEIDPNCIGNTAVCSGSQVAVVPGAVEQRRSCTQNLGGDPNRTLPVRGGDVKFQSTPKFDIYNPAQDQDYLNGVLKK